MTTPSTDTHPSMDACPPLEDIAAFLDGTLSPEERERMTAHLARCESCYEIFIGAAEFQEEEESSAGDADRRGVIAALPLGGERTSESTAPPPAKARRTASWMPLAASVLLAAGLGYFAYQALRPPKITLARVAGSVDGKPVVADNLYKSTVYRNVPPPSPYYAAEFMTGVYLLDLRLSGTSEANDDLLKDLAGELKDSPMTQDLVQSYWDESLNFQGSEETGRQDLEDEIQERLHEETSTFSFGLWAEGGRIAAATRSSEFFKRRDNRGFLANLLEKELPVPLELQEQVLGDLQAIERLWGKDLPSLEKRFESIIDAIDRYEEEFPEEGPL